MLKYLIHAHENKSNNSMQQIFVELIENDAAM